MFVARNEEKRVGCGAILMGCFVMAFILCTLFKPYLLGPLPLLNLEQSVAFSFKALMMSTENVSQPQQSYIDAKSVRPIIGNLSNTRSQVYDLKGDVRIHGNSSTIFIASTTNTTSNHWTTTPYARTSDPFAMRKAKKFEITLFDPRITTPPRCRRSFDVPAIVFSTRGYTGNVFHDFTDILIPLYATSRRFNRSVLFLASDKRRWWTSKYKQILDGLSEYDTIDLNRENGTLCFSNVIIGLKANNELGIDPSESPDHSIDDFREFIRSTYSLTRKFVNYHSRPPRLLIVSRRKNRRLTNEDEVADTARRLGFDVDLTEMGSEVSSVAKFVNGFDVMVGVHGAGLTNMVFLPVNGVVIQIVPIGLEPLARYFFQIPGERMKLRCLEYKVTVNESSLLGKYPWDSKVFRDPGGVHEDWHVFRSIYLDDQDVRVDVDRFRETLLKALELVRA